MTVAQGLALVACAGLYGVSLRHACKGSARPRVRSLPSSWRLNGASRSASRELRQEVEDRRRIEHLNRGQKQILEMLADPGDLLNTEDILQHLAGVVASPATRDGECAIHLVERNGKLLHLAANSEVAERLKGYLENVGTEYPDTPECQGLCLRQKHTSSNTLASSVWDGAKRAGLGRHLLGLGSSFLRPRFHASLPEH